MKSSIDCSLTHWADYRLCEIPYGHKNIYNPMKKLESLLPEIEHFETKSAKSPDQNTIKATTSFSRPCLPPFTRAR